MRSRSILLVGSGALLALFACGEKEEGNTFPENPGSATASEDAGKSATFNESSEGGSRIDQGDAGVTKCVGTAANLEPLPLQLIIALDRSGSMCETLKDPGASQLCSNPATKWAITMSGLRSFFASTESKGITTSILQFPDTTPCAPGTDAKCIVPACGADLYLTPGKVPVQSLPNASSLADAITTPKTGSEVATPTAGALRAAIQYADTVSARGERVAIVVATDGAPAACVEGALKPMELVTQIAAAAASRFPIYAIGVGDTLNLNAIAVAGGTGTAFAATDSAGLVTALNSIRGNGVPCEYAIPAPPEGKTLDYTKVNVVSHDTSKVSRAVVHSADCSNLDGWHYDDENAPKKILLCSAACTTARSASIASVDVVLGCATNSPVDGVN